MSEVTCRICETVIHSDGEENDICLDCLQDGERNNPSKGEAQRMRQLAKELEREDR